MREIIKMADKIKNQKEDCIFCKIVSREIKNDFLYEDDNFVVVNDIKPVMPGHCLIIVKKHYETILDVPSTLGTEIFDIAKKQGFRLMKEKKAEGFNFVQNNFKVAGQVVNHFHIHVIPRKLNDGIKLG